MVELKIFEKPLAFVAAGALCLGLSACGGGAGSEEKVDLGDAAVGTVKDGVLKGKTITFSSYGGILQNGQMDAAGKPFAKESGAKVLSDGPTEYAKIKSQVDSGNVNWDVVDVNPQFAAANCGTLFEPLDTSVIDTSKLTQPMDNKCTVPAFSYAGVLVYNKEKYGDNPPQNWADFYDTEKFPGKRSIEGGTGIEPSVLESAILADGVDPADLYPLDLDRAFKKLDTIRDDVVFWDTATQSQQLIESGEVDMAIMWSGRAYSAIKNGAPYEVQWNGHFQFYDALAVLKGSRNSQAAMAFINYYLGAKQQEELTKLTTYSPVNKDAKPQVDALLTSFLLSSPEKQKTAVKINVDWWAKNNDTAVTQYNAWLAG